MLYIQLCAQMCHLCQYMCAPASVLINQISCSACASTPAVQICSISHGPGECERVNSLTDTHTQAPPPQSSVKWGSATVWGLSDNKTHFTAAALYRTGLHRALAKAQQLPRLFNLHLLRPNTPSLSLSHTHNWKKSTHWERESLNQSTPSTATLWTERDVFLNEAVNFSQRQQIIGRLFDDTHPPSSSLHHTDRGKEMWCYILKEQFILLFILFYFE